MWMTLKKTEQDKNMNITCGKLALATGNHI